jgi:hypothetical protein
MKSFKLIVRVEDEKGMPWAETERRIEQGLNESSNIVLFSPADERIVDRIVEQAEDNFNHRNDNKF